MQTARKYYSKIDGTAPSHFAFWPVAKQHEAIGYPEDAFMIEVTDRASLKTKGLFSCHAVAIGGLRDDGMAALYLSHNLAEYWRSTIVHLGTVLTFMWDAGYVPTFAASMGPSDRALEGRGFAAMSKFEGIASVAIGECVAEAGIEQQVFMYDEPTAKNSIVLRYVPDVVPKFTVACANAVLATA